MICYNYIYWSSLFYRPHWKQCRYAPSNNSSVSGIPWWRLILLQRSISFSRTRVWNSGEPMSTISSNRMACTSSKSWCNVGANTDFGWCARFPTERSDPPGPHWCGLSNASSSNVKSLRGFSKLHVVLIPSLFNQFHVNNQFFFLFFIVVLLLLLNTQNRTKFSLVFFFF
jgi:hypothetical protein